MLFAAEFASGFGLMALDISIGSIFASVIPDQLRSRVSGAFSAVNYGVRPLGALAGGLLGSSIGLRPTRAALSPSGSLYVSYGRRAHTCRLGSLGDDAVSVEDRESAQLEGGEDTSAIRIVIGRGSALHAVTGRSWYRFELDEHAYG